MRKLFPLLLIVFVLWSRFHFRSAYLYTWDSVQFALSLKKFDVRLHQPHPPGYVLYSYSMRFVHWLIPDVNLAFIVFNIFATIGACLLLFGLFKILLSTEDSSRQFLFGASASLLYATAPVSWQHGCVAEIYAVEGFFVCLVIYLCVLSDQKPGYLIWASATLAVAGGFRPSTEVLLLPFYLLSLRHKQKTILVRSLIVLCAVNLLWLGFLASTVGGPWQYTRILKLQLREAASVTNRLMQQTDVLNRPIFLVLFRVLQIITLPVFVAILLRLHKIRFRSDQVRMIVAFAPGVLFFMFAHFTKDGYLMAIMPGIIVFSILTLERLYHKLSFLVAILFLSCLVNYWIFTRPPLFSSEELQQEPMKRIAAIFTTPNKHVIRAHNTRLRDFFKQVESLKASSRLFVVVGDSFPGWRLIMYYYPEDQAILANTGKTATIANQYVVRRVKPPVEISQQNVALIAVGPQPPEIKMNSFDVYEYRYYYSNIEDLPKNFSVYSVRFRTDQVSR